MSTLATNTQLKMFFSPQAHVTASVKNDNAVSQNCLHKVIC